MAQLLHRGDTRDLENLDNDRYRKFLCGDDAWNPI